MSLVEKKTGETNIPPAKLIFSRTIDTIAGEREIQLFWGNYVDLITLESCVLISSNTFQEKNGMAPVGMAWRSLKNHFSIDTPLPFEKIVGAEPNSAIWPVSPSLEKGWHNIEENDRPYIDCTTVPNKGLPRIEPPRKLFCLHTLPFQRYITTEDDYKYALGACLAAIRAQEAADLVLHNVKQPYQEIVMTALAGRQTETPHELLKTLMEEVEDWFIISPRIKTIKICYWSLKIQKTLEARIAELGKDTLSTDNSVADNILRNDLLSILNEKAIDSGELKRESTAILIKEFRQAVEIYLDEEKLSTEVKTALNNMQVILGRVNPTVLEIGGAAGRLAEGLVNHLYESFFGKRPGTFHNGIEDLAAKNPNTEKYAGLKISNWYKSYLHTLRILRNTCAHSQDEPENQYPSKLETSDTWILIVNLKRVLELHIKLLNLPEK